MHPMLNIAVRAARAAGNVITRGFENRNDLLLEKKGENDFVTKIDKEAEKVIIEKIQQSFPDHSFLGEEGGIVEGSDEFKWIIDPLDGTTNFIKGIPHFAVSIALMHKGRIDQAVVFDPIRGELFTASKGAGAQLNGFRIRTGKAKDLNNTVLATAFPFKAKETSDDAIQRFSNIFKQCGDVRRCGSAALDLAYVAAGRYDGYWERGIKPWDVAAGELLVRESGGLVTDYKGGNDPLDKGEIVAGNPRVVQSLVRHLK
ncbi:MULTISPECIES: inositol-1-monophosphatase [Alteromonadaceae]|uniref:inositol-1-monophosphatase n=1 Tax=Alteromonadaceae TaxID=72275 RepID=UPI001C083180|nr:MULTISPECIES: inositol-1-monophosphatase [Aliiglaciecola]MBU2879761.1 inositol-1-monophosphatase [Aliiglaciecola lipolytica]MDO6709960.1 inositol-1-monophosphatase [Aliiglaciecola sp. 2_MG-2023]MDO6751108.1 inositol-1-monophosphatase [Aliiglaciecola sp. 1_MG-2023]